MAKIAWFKVLTSTVVIALMLPHPNIHAQESNATEQVTTQKKPPTTEAENAISSESSVQQNGNVAETTRPARFSKRPSVKYFESNEKVNQIPYFDNRFRIDAHIEEITMLFYRKSGTPPIILVRPDGSKLKINNIDKSQVEWFDDRTFDMVKIKKPMPGPWQAIGAIDKSSQIMVLSEVRIEVDPLPEILLSGETLKITGRLFNGEDAIDNPAFRDVIELDVDFYSTNNSAFDNFGAEPIKLTSFRDDGRDLDEYSGDGIFTGEFELAFAPGEWQPLYYVNLPMAKRELRQKPVIVRHTPATLSVEQVHEVGKSHLLNFTIDATFVDPDSMIFQGKISYPDKSVEPFSIMEGSGEKRQYKIEYTEPGIHRINVNAFGITKEGREFRLVIPQFAFNVERIEEVETLGDETLDGSISVESQLAKIKTLEERDAEMKQELEEARLAFEAKEAEEQKETLIVIGVVNGTIILIALIGIAAIRFKRKRAQQVK